MSDAMVLMKERNEICADVLDGKIPKRVPVYALITMEFAIQYAGRDLTESQWDTSVLDDIFDRTCADFYSDSMPISAFRFPSFYKLLGAKNFVMGSNGFLQHPEVEGMAEEDYDAFIENPYNCIIERILPRIYSELNTDSSSKALALTKAFKAYQDDMGTAVNLYGKLIGKYGYCSNVNLFGGFCEAPFDFVSDQLRGFKGISKDVRRIPQKVKAAVEAVAPLMLKMGTPVNPTPYNATFIPLHMAPYMRDKDFANLYWPTFKELCENLVKAGGRNFIFVEQDWMRYLDYLYELPEGTVMMFEYGDAKTIKDKLGKKHIISGLYPLTLLNTGTREECIDKAKELIDILAPGGKYVFSFDKVPVTVDSVKVENYRAVLEYAAQNAKY
ncbi:uroporphyrinogen decarboxylase (URO-D) [Oxobacter pfennigii]|uniref:Uroporphyrinogen decarboxylase (URO-D) n=1 Tax=Oxobacter pfennigii TaxID=36849 RepID=A0A0P9AFW8_9CLOT|nr:uroporphyrinogen decarboxylase family protein [Oxobacter pfennigii]KPU44266.1 uroporphyrinogen decarboxylase (URO-D) [Oxobacter pfennigii]